MILQHLHCDPAVADEHLVGVLHPLRPFDDKLRDHVGSCPQAVSSRVAAHAHVQGLIVLTSPMILTQRALIVDLALKARLPMISGFTTFPRAGGLMAYGPDLPSMFKRAASYVDRILRGAKAGDLPIERPSKFELTIGERSRVCAKKRTVDAHKDSPQSVDRIIDVPELRRAGDGPPFSARRTRL